MVKNAMPAWMQARYVYAAAALVTMRPARSRVPLFSQFCSRIFQRLHNLDMLECGSNVRFTSTEVDELAELGIDVAGAKSAEDFAAALEPWLHALAETRPDVIDKIAKEFAARKRVRQPPE